MGSILEKIEQALKDMLIGWIESNLTNMFTDVNEKVGTIAAEVGQTPSGWNGGVYQMIRGLSENVIVPIAGIIITFVLCYELISMITEKNNLHDMDTWMFFKWFFKAAVAIYLVTHTFDIVMAVFDIGQNVVSGAAGVIHGNTSIDIDATIAQMRTGIVQMTGDLVKAYPFLSDAEAQRFGTGKEEIGKCPRCGSPVYVGKGNFYCSNKECSFCLWEDNKFFSSKKKKLTKRIAKELLDKGWCRVTGLYTPKKPQLYDAVIRLDDSGGKYVSFKMEFDR